jgi:hypothetical protein
LPTGTLTKARLPSQHADLLIVLVMDEFSQLLLLLELWGSDKLFALSMECKDGACYVLWCRNYTIATT